MIDIQTNVQPNKGNYCYSISGCDGENEITFHFHLDTKQHANIFVVKSYVDEEPRWVNMTVEEEGIRDALTQVLIDWVNTGIAPTDEEMQEQMELIIDIVQDILDWLFNV